MFNSLFKSSIPPELIDENELDNPFSLPDLPTKSKEPQEIITKWTYVKTKPEKKKMMNPFKESTVHEWLEIADIKREEEGSEEWKAAVLNRLELVREELEETIKAVKDGNISEVYDGCVDIFWTASNVSFLLNQEKLRDYHNAVRESNYSKFAKTEKEAQDTVDFYAQGTHADKMGEKIKTSYRKVKNFFVIFREDGKIMKSHKYKPVEWLIKALTY